MTEKSLTHSYQTFVYQVSYTVKPVLRGHFWDKEYVGFFLDSWPLKTVSIYMNFSMTGQEKGDILIQVAA